MESLMNKRICRILVTGCVAVMFASLSTAAEADKPRLKFKGKGPVCMCANGGLTEDDIRRANEARQSRLEQLRGKQDRQNRDGRGGNRDESNNQESN